MRNRNRIYLIIVIAAITLIVTTISIEFNTPNYQSTVRNSSITANTTSTTTTTLSNNSTTITQSSSSVANIQSKNTIKLGDITLCATNCYYPNQYLGVTVFVNTTTPLRSLNVTIDSTQVSYHGYANNFTNPYAIQYKASFEANVTKIVAGKTYNIIFIATFENKDKFAATKTATAINGQ